jgi:hypothetical protein
LIGRRESGHAYARFSLDSRDGRRREGSLKAFPAETIRWSAADFLPAPDVQLKPFTPQDIRRILTASPMDSCQFWCF